MKRKRTAARPAMRSWERTYDKSAKNLIATRQFLAMILKEHVPEFQPFDRETIERDCIDGKPWVEEIPVEPGKTNRKRRARKIRGLNTEQSIEDEGYITYDVLFYAHVPGTGERVKLLINIEAQRTEPSYSLYRRAYFYACRLVSSQKEYDFVGQDYDSICKVYSIWLCFYLPEGETSSITSYGFGENPIVGNHTIPKSVYDLMNITMIHVGDDDESEDTLIRFLRLVFLSQWTEQELARKLQKEFGITPNEETKKEMTKMCNLSTGLIERAEARGEARGKAKGEARGRAEAWAASARNLMKNLKLTAQQAVDAIAVPVEFRAKVLEELCV